MDIRKLEIKSLQAAEYNPRRDLQQGDREYADIKQSIEAFGFVQPIVVNGRFGRVVGGHQRLKVLEELGYAQVDCVVVDLDEAAEKALNLALNKISGAWDTDKLEVLLRELSSAPELALTGFSAEELAEILRAGDLQQVEDDLFDDPLPEAPFTQPGDIWLLGKHRLMCGDATKPEDYAALMDGEPAALIVTDPPYNVDYAGKAGKIKNDCMPPAEFAEFLRAAFAAMCGAAADGAGLYCFHSDRETVSFRTALETAGFFVHQTCVWVKNSAVLGRCDYQHDYEPCFFGGKAEDAPGYGYEVEHQPICYGWRPGAAHRWFADRKQRTVWRFDRPVKSKYHPTMKPVELIAYCLANSSMPGEAVLDPFGGSGTTMVAAEQLGRCCRLLEIDPQYVDATVSRFIRLVGSADDVFLVRGGVGVPAWEIAALLHK